MKNGKSVKCNSYFEKLNYDNSPNPEKPLLSFSGILTFVLAGLLLLRFLLMDRPPSKKRTEQQLKSAQQHLAVGDYEGAQRMLPAAEQGSSLSHDIYLCQAHIFRGQRKFSEGLAWISTLQELDSALRVEKGRFLVEMGNYQEAVADLEAGRDRIQDEETLLDLATGYYLSGEVVKAWEILSETVLESCNGRLLALAGDCHFHWKDYTLAIQFYQQAQHHGWLNRRTLARTGHSLCCTGEVVEAERYFREILQYDSADTVATLGLGQCLERRGLYRRALMIYQSGEAWDLADPVILRQAGICAVHAGRHDFAEVYLKEAIDRGAESPQSLAFLGYSFEAQKEWEEAEKVYIQLVKEYPHHIAGYRALSWMYGVGLSTLTTPSEALSYATAALDKAPDDESWELLSACEARAGNFSRAHSIQEQLWAQASDKHTRNRRRHAMKALRKKQPLGERHVIRALVA